MRANPQYPKLHVGHVRDEVDQEAAVRYLKQHDKHSNKPGATPSGHEKQTKAKKVAIDQDRENGNPLHQELSPCLLHQEPDSKCDVYCSKHRKERSPAPDGSSRIQDP